MPTLCRAIATDMGRANPIAIVAILASLASGPALGADEIAGAARVFRGDGGCDPRSKAALNDLVKGRHVVCTIVAKGGHGSVQATCTLDGADVAEMIVCAGWARAELGMSDAYIDAEQDARSRQVGMWRK